MSPLDEDTRRILAWRGPWDAAWQALGLAAPAGLYEALLDAWREPQRHYHTLQHLGECLDLLARERTLARDPASLLLALWFHDAVYDVQGHDNEARSADWAAAALRQAGAGAAGCDRVHALVMATRHEARPQDADAQLLIDIDLAILGAPAPRFAQYEQQIRAEYAHVPPAVFEPRRRLILGRFLAREPLYQTPGLRAEREAQARANLHRALRAG